MKSEISDYELNQKLIKNQEIVKNKQRLRLEKEVLQNQKQIERQKRQEMKSKNNNRTTSLFSNFSNNQNKNKTGSKDTSRISNPVIIEEENYNSDNLNMDTGITKANDNHKLLRYKNLNLPRGSLRSRGSGNLRRTNTVSYLMMIQQL
ncbi:unnamed protein product [[Candida] boidinii]|nr:unnamed protein product [[Candida] boidinii]